CANWAPIFPVSMEQLLRQNPTPTRSISRRWTKRRSSCRNRMQKDVIAIVISPDRSVHRQVEDALSQGGYADTVLAVSEYPDSMNLARLKEYQTGCVLFLDFADPVGARRIAEELDRAYPFVSVIAVHSNPTREDVMSLMQLGVRELIGKPIAESDLAVAFVR